MELHFSLLLKDNYLMPIVKKPYKIKIADITIEGTTDGEGFLQHDSIPPGDFELIINDISTFIPSMPRSYKRRVHIVLG